VKFLPGRDPGRSRPQLRFGHIPGNAPTVEGLQRKLEPLFFSHESRLRGGVTTVEIAATGNEQNAMKPEGGCYCGAVRYVAEGDPVMRAQCHCRECQYITGGAPNMSRL
jgi:hypothetical protein